MELRIMIPAVSPCTRQVPPAEITTKMHDTTSWGGGGGRLTTCPENVNSHGDIKSTKYVLTSSVTQETSRSL